MFNNEKYCHHMTDIVALLNRLSGYDRAPHKDMLWGHCITSMVAIANTYQQLGVGGSHKQQQVKQAIAAMLIMDGNKIVNKA